MPIARPASMRGFLKGENPADLPVPQGEQVRFRHQPGNRESPRPCRADAHSRCRRRGDRIAERREFITAARRRGCDAIPRARARSVSAFGALACFLPAAADDLDYQRLGRRRSAGAAKNGVGPSAAMCTSTRAGPRPTPLRFAGTRRNWPRSRPTSFWPTALSPWEKARCYR